MRCVAAPHVEFVNRLVNAMWSLTLRRLAHQRRTVVRARALGGADKPRGFEEVLSG
jgi:hypothetical protein